MRRLIIVVGLLLLLVPRPSRACFNDHKGQEKWFANQGSSWANYDDLRPAGDRDQPPITALLMGGSGALVLLGGLTAGYVRAARQQPAIEQA